MECYTHPGQRAVAVCVECRHGLCADCAVRRDPRGICAPCQSRLAGDASPLATAIATAQACYQHASPAVALCQRCLRPLCRECAATADGPSLCADCARAESSSLAKAASRPALAFPVLPDGKPALAARRVGEAQAASPGPERPVSRRDVLSLIALASSAAAIGLIQPWNPPVLPVARVAVADPGLLPWVQEVVSADPYLRERVRLEAGPAGATPAPDAGWIGLAGGATSTSGEGVVVASSPYVVAAWEGGLVRLGLAPDAPVDWAALRHAIAGQGGRWVRLPTAEAPLGADGLALLAFVHFGQQAAALPPAAASDPALRQWLLPFFPPQSKARSVEQVHLDDWASQRESLGQAGMLPEHAALALIAVVEPQSRLHVRYPPVNLSRRYVLVAPPGGQFARIHERLRAALLSPDGQRALARRGFRPAAPGVTPDGTPFAARRDRGVRWEAQWSEAPRSVALAAFVQEWQP